MARRSLLHDEPLHGLQCTSEDGRKAVLRLRRARSGREHQDEFGQHFASFIKFAFFVSLGLTVASLFLDFTPSFSKCAVSSIVLLLAKSSADQMLEKKKD